MSAAAAYLIEQMEAMIAAAMLDVPLIRRECFGRCEHGPVMRFVASECRITAAGNR